MRFQESSQRVLKDLYNEGTSFRGIIEKSFWGLNNMIL